MGCPSAWLCDNQPLWLIRHYAAPLGPCATSLVCLQDSDKLLLLKDAIRAQTEYTVMVSDVALPCV